MRSGDLVKLRAAPLPNARVREFTFIRMDGDKVLLAHKEGHYECELHANDIDWCI